jgi:hypothetical protein
MTEGKRNHPGEFFGGSHFPPQAAENAPAFAVQMAMMAPHVDLRGSLAYR